MYCNFYSRTDLSLIPDYVNALQREIEKRSGLKGEINTIYFGGGTPSLLRVKDVASLLKTIDDHFSVSRDVEVTLEVNPGTVDLKYLNALKDVGINRLSIGVQSLKDDKLKFLGRIHTAGQARRIVEDAGKAGFDDVSMDLIYGLPFETETTWLEDLTAALRLRPSHLSCYMLTIEPGTPLEKQSRQGLIKPLGHQAMSALFKKTVQFLEASNYEHYEISNFSRGSRNRSKHNSKYWEMIPYYGFGAAAHAYDGTTRSWNYKSIHTYIKRIAAGRLPVEDREILTREQKMMEMIMLRLRTLEGLDLKKFQILFHVAFETQFKTILDSIFDASLGFIKAGRFALTLEGKCRLNGIVEAFARHLF